MKGTGKNNSAWWYESNGRKLFHVQREDIHMSFGRAPDFTRRSVGYVGFSDGWQDWMDNFKMDWEFEQAEDGNLALIGEIDWSVGHFKVDSFLMPFFAAALLGMLMLLAALRWLPESLPKTSAAAHCSSRSLWVSLGKLW